METIIRDKFQNSNEFYQKNIQEYLEILKISKAKIANNDVNDLSSYYDYLSDICKRLISLKYSAGYQITEIIQDFDNCISYMEMALENGLIEKFPLPIYQLEFILSLGILLKYKKERFDIIVNFINKNGRKDYLLDFLLSGLGYVREKFLEETYPYGLSKIKSQDSTLREAVRSESIEKSKLLLDKYLEKEHIQLVDKNAASNSRDKSPMYQRTYYTGYWSFECAAIVKVLGIDDSGWEKYKAYPWDIVHYE